MPVKYICNGCTEQCVLEMANGCGCHLGRCPRAGKANWILYNEEPKEVPVIEGAPYHMEKSPLGVVFTRCG